MRWRHYHDGMATPGKARVEVDGDLLERARRVARERGVEVPQLVHDALEHEIGHVASAQAEDEGEQPALTCIGAFSTGRGDLSKLASEDVFEPEPPR
jgi:post-segregation antitoxin (ccd killing protein)